MAELHTEEDSKLEGVRKTQRHQRYACILLEERKPKFYNNKICKKCNTLLEEIIFGML